MAYERWKKTPEYQQWLESTGQIMAEASTPEAKPFVIVGSKDTPERKFGTLAEAVLSASYGDTIEVRGNGPFVCEPIVLYTSLTLRAGVGYRPVLRLSRTAAEASGTLLTTDAPLTVEGLESAAH